MLKRTELKEIVSYGESLSKSNYCAQRKYLRSGGILKLRPVPHTERNKDNKTLNDTSTPPGANILLGVRLLSQPKRV
jgi:hypothetical protein